MKSSLHDFDAIEDEVEQFRQEIMPKNYPYCYSIEIFKKLLEDWENTRLKNQGKHQELFDYSKKNQPYILCLEKRSW